MQVCCCSMAGSWYCLNSCKVNKVDTMPMSYGWVCPRCGRVNSPQFSQCTCNIDKYKYQIDYVNSSSGLSVL